MKHFYTRFTWSALLPALIALTISACVDSKKMGNYVEVEHKSPIQGEIAPQIPATPIQRPDQAGQTGKEAPVGSSSVWSEPR
jgi:hypothetical protein